eukprot:1649265-Pleurochrysis_carterae.AAC.1
MSKCRQVSNRVPRRGGAHAAREAVGWCSSPAWDARRAMRRLLPRSLAAAGRAVERSRRRFVAQWPRS